ncbi:YXWGXW repeat-containing protein [Lichenicola cladoniae]|uniref:YXWGXW repeat-containing protein n=1 Tax=Lichenicola cladoniae TaxID=1484109 RepID=UPI001952D437|nr:YXWGXW repeat-containing protein [Lichenicola cladoniae]
MTRSFWASVLLMALMTIATYRTAGAGALPDQSIGVSNFRGTGRLPLFVSRDWSKPQYDITRAVITIHGEQRDADTTDSIAQAGLAKAGPAGLGTLLVTPLFPDDDDRPAADTLRWHHNEWMDGQMASAPAALSSFDAMDAIIARLSDHSLFPALKTIVLVGHSGGGQFVQRYAVLTHGEARAAQAGIAMRYVIANPSSYAYFSPDRPTEAGGFTPYPLDQCHRFNRWKYGLEDLPIYGGDARPSELERDYVQRDIEYLLGTLDTDPDRTAIDKSCGAEAQGPNRYERGHDYFRYLQARHPSDLRQQLHDVPGVGHDTSGMLTSDCALAAIYDAPLCGRRPAATAVVTTAPPVTVHGGSEPAAHPQPVTVTPGLRIHHHPRPLPRPRTERRRAAPASGYAWQPGGWNWNGYDYVWLPGRWVQKRAVSRHVARPIYEPPHWQYDGDDWIWVPAHWE